MYLLLNSCLVAYLVYCLFCGVLFGLSCYSLVVYCFAFVTLIDAGCCLYFVVWWFSACCLLLNFTLLVGV